MKCDRVMTVNATKIFWQLLIEKEFLYYIIGTLSNSTHSRRKTGGKVLSLIQLDV